MSQTKAQLLGPVHGTVEYTGDQNFHSGTLFVDATNARVGIGTTDPTNKLTVGTNPNSYSSYALIHNPNGVDATTKAELSDNAVLTLQPHGSNSTHMSFGQVNQGGGVGIQVTNYDKTVDWDICLNPFGGNVGINTTTPGFKLDVNVTGVETGIRIYNPSSASDASGMLRMGNDTNANAAFLRLNSSNNTAAAGGADALVLGHGLQKSVVIATQSVARITVSGTGNVGIGTTDPINKLEVYGTDTVTVVTTNGTGRYRGFDIYESGNRKSYFYHDSVGDITMINTYENNLEFHCGDTPQLKLSTSLYANNAVAGIQLYSGKGLGFDESGTRTHALIPSFGRLKYVSGDGNGGFTVSHGSLIVGDVDTSSKLEVFAPAQSSHLTLSANDAGGSDQTAINLDWLVKDTSHIVGRIKSYYYSSTNGGSGGLRFYNRQSGTLNEALRISYSGNVGIGTLDPNSKLHVHGGRLVLGNALASQTGIQFNSDNTEMAVLYRPSNSTTQMNLYLAGPGDMHVWQSLGAGVPGYQELRSTVRIGAAVDYGSSTVLTVAPGVIKFDNAGQSGGILNIDSSNDWYINNSSYPYFYHPDAHNDEGFNYNDVRSPQAGMGGWVYLGSNQNNYSPYSIKYYKIADHDGAQGTRVYQIWHDGDANYHFGGLYEIRLNGWGSTSTRFESVALRCVNGDRTGLELFAYNANNNGIWIRASNPWGNLWIRKAGWDDWLRSRGASKCAVDNNGPLAEASADGTAGTLPAGGYSLYANAGYYIENGTTFNG